MSRTQRTILLAGLFALGGPGHVELRNARVFP